MKTAIAAPHPLTYRDKPGVFGPLSPRISQPHEIAPLFFSNGKISVPTLIPLGISDHSAPYVVRGGAEECEGAGERGRRQATPSEHQSPTHRAGKLRGEQIALIALNRRCRRGISGRGARGRCGGKPPGRVKLFAPPLLGRIAAVDAGPQEAAISRRHVGRAAGLTKAKRRARRAAKMAIPRR